MADQTRKELVEMLYAYSIGCLDKAEFLKLREYIRSNEDYAWEEMGEFQNLSAMLPAILNVESPERQLKDKVARKLYRLREQKRPLKAVTEIKMFKTTPPGELPETDLTEEESQNKFEKKLTDDGLEIYQPVDEIAEEPADEIEKETTQNKILPTVEEFEEIEKKEDVTIPEVIDDKNSKTESQNLKRELEQVRPSQQTQIKERNFNKSEHEIKTPPKKESPANDEINKSITKPVLTERRKEGIPLSTFLLSLVLVVIIIGAGFGYFYFNGIIEDKDNRIKSLQSAFDNLVLERDINNELLQLVKAQDLFVSHLKPAANHSGFSGRVIASSSLNRAYVMLNNLPELEESKVYQFWVTYQGRNISLGMLYPDKKEFVKPIDDLSLIPFGEQMQFILTEEFIGGGERPSRQVYLTSQ